MKQQESLTILPSPIISCKGKCLAAPLGVHPSLSPLGFIWCGCFAEYLAFLLSITLPILFWYWIYLFLFYTSAYSFLNHFFPDLVLNHISMPLVIMVPIVYNKLKKSILSQPFYPLFTGRSFCINPKGNSYYCYKPKPI